MSDPANTAPKFADQDLTVEGDQSDETTRSVAENMEDETVGNPCECHGRLTETPSCSRLPSGPDADSFKVDNNGQIRTKVKLDYETQDTYMVALTAVPTPRVLLTASW